MMRGLFITMEGLDGCGKSTQLSLLVGALSEQASEIVVTREPGGTPIGEGVRGLLVSEASLKIAAITELFLIIAARAQHVVEVIAPALEAGRILISDRYADSSVAFQGYGRGLDLALVNELNKVATRSITPDLTIVLDLEPAEAQSRLSHRPVGGLLGALDEEKLDFHARVRKGYLDLAATQPSRVRLVDASGSAAETHAKVMELVSEIIATRHAR
jgi:dTMP kinase